LKYENVETCSTSQNQNNPERRQLKLEISSELYGAERKFLRAGDMATNATSTKPLEKSLPNGTCKIKFKDLVEFTDEPLRPYTDANLISLLRQVMKLIDKNQKIIAKEIGISTTTMSSYFTNKRSPSGWNSIERKLKKWITNLDIDFPAPREYSQENDIQKKPKWNESSKKFLALSNCNKFMATQPIETKLHSF
jgi:transcriptional regulator with XRE-family HTH domain